MIKNSWETIKANDFNDRESLLFCPGCNAIYTISLARMTVHFGVVVGSPSFKLGHSETCLVLSRFFFTGIWMCNQKKSLFFELDLVHPWIAMGSDLIEENRMFQIMKKRIIKIILHGISTSPSSIWVFSNHGEWLPSMNLHGWSVYWDSRSQTILSRIFIYTFHRLRHCKKMLLPAMMQ